MYFYNSLNHYRVFIVVIIILRNTSCTGKPALVHGLEGNRISRVSCGSSHSVCWTTPEAPITSCHEPVLFTAAKDPLGAGFVSGTSNNCGRGIEPGIQHNTFDHLADSRQSSSSITGIASASGFENFHSRKSSSSTTKPSLSRIILSLESNSSKQVQIILIFCTVAISLFEIYNKLI